MLCIVFYLRETMHNELFAGDRPQVAYQQLDEEDSPPSPQQLSPSP